MKHQDVELLCGWFPGADHNIALVSLPFGLQSYVSLPVASSDLYLVWPRPCPCLVIHALVQLLGHLEALYGLERLHMKGEHCGWQTDMYGLGVVVARLQGWDVDPIVGVTRQQGMEGNGERVTLDDRADMRRFSWDRFPTTAPTGRFSSWAVNSLRASSCVAFSACFDASRGTQRCSIS